MEDNDWKDELTDDYIHDLEADFEALKQRHKKLVDECKNIREFRDSAGSDDYDMIIDQICNILDEEPIND